MARFRKSGSGCTVRTTRAPFQSDKPQRYHRTVIWLRSPSQRLRQRRSAVVGERFQHVGPGFGKHTRLNDNLAVRPASWGAPTTVPTVSSCRRACLPRF